MIPLCVPNLAENEKKYLDECVDSTFVSSVGPFVGQFEREIAKAAGVPYAMATSAGTTALHIALVACGVKRDDLVIIPSYTFIATANAVAHCGAQPLLVDMERSSWTMDVSLLEEELGKNTEIRNEQVIYCPTGQRIAAIMPVYTLGNVAKMDILSGLAQQYGLPVIADAAAAIGATDRGRPIGELATATVFSFNGNKTITSGGGGAVVSADQALSERIRHLLSTARIGTEYTHDMVGYNYRMTNIAAAVGLAQIEQLDKFVAKKREIRSFYNDAFKDSEKCELFPDQDGESVCWFSGILLESETAVRHLCKVLAAHEIEARTFWKPMHLQPPYKDCMRTGMDCCENLWSRVLTLPCSTGITYEELEKVCAAVKEGMKVL